MDRDSGWLALQAAAAVWRGRGWGHGGGGNGGENGGGIRFWISATKFRARLHDQGARDGEVAPHRHLA